MAKGRVYLKQNLAQKQLGYSNDVLVYCNDTKKKD